MASQFNLKTWEWIDDPVRKRVFNRALFTVVAARYSIVTQALSFGRDRFWKRRLLRMCPDGSEVRCCVDLACGTADITRDLATRYPDAVVFGVDLTPEMLAHARRRNVPDNITLVHGDMTSTGIRDGGADIVTGGYALRNAPSLDAALAETMRLLRPGGTALFLDFSKPTSRVLQRLQYYLLACWGGLWGLLLHGNPEIYAYIAKSLQRFPDREAFHIQLARHGFKEIQSVSFFGGMLALTRISKPISTCSS